jgi:hypothetical protein
MAAFSYRVADGLVDVSDSFSDEQVLDMSNEIAMLDDDESQFFTISTQLGSREFFNPRFSWLEDSYLPNTTTVATSATSIATNIVVATGTGTYFRSGAVIRNITKGDAYLAGTTYSNSVDVTRAIGVATASAAATGDVLVITGYASAEGATLPAAKIAQKSTNYNYTQIHRNVMEFSNTNTAIERYGEQEPMREKAKKLVEHRREIDKSAFLGARHIITSGSEPQRMTGGLIEYVTVNKTNISGTLTASALDNHLANVFQYGSKNKVMFVGPTAQRAISGFLRSAWQPATVGEKKYGAFVDGYLSGAYGWNVPIYTQRDWNRVGLGGYIFTVDLANVRMGYLRGRSTKYLPNRQTAGKDSFASEYLSEFGFEVRLDETHGILYGITG